jgi:AcrR family transcriptional regulator
MGRDNRGQEEKMQNILEATLSVISQETIGGTRMHLIAKEAGVSQSILHYYFSSKKDILVRLMQDLKVEFNEKRTRDVDPVNKPLQENIEGFLNQKKDIIKNQQEMDIAQFDFFVQSLVDEDLKKVFQDFFKAWYDEIKEVILQSDIPQENKDKFAKSMSHMLLSLMMGASMQYLLWEGDDFDVDLYFDQVEEMFLGYLRGKA